MSDIQERIQQALDKRGMSWAAAAVAIGLSEQAPAKWKKGQIGRGTAIKLAELLKVDSGYLLTGTGSPVVAEAKIMGGFDEWDENSESHPDDVDLPLYKEVELAAGAGTSHSVEFNHGRKLKFAKSTLRAAHVQVENAACALVTGNSMEPRIADGATIGIDRGATAIRDGKIYAIDHDGMLRVKFLYRMVGGGLRLHSENEAEHPDEIYTAHEVAEKIKVLGKVFWVSQMMD